MRECRVSEFFSAPSIGPRKVIDLDGIWLSLDGHTVLEDITFSLAEGTFLGVIGPNGAGKTSLIRVILGLLRPTRGTVRVMGLSPGSCGTNCTTSATCPSRCSSTRSFRYRFTTW